jgi:hypothetical protein
LVGFGVKVEVRVKVWVGVKVGGKVAELVGVGDGGGEVKVAVKVGFGVIVTVGVGILVRVKVGVLVGVQVMLGVIVLVGATSFEVRINAISQGSPSGPTTGSPFSKGEPIPGTMGFIIRTAASMNSCLRVFQPHG